MNVTAPQLTTNQMRAANECCIARLVWASTATHCRTDKQIEQAQHMLELALGVFLQPNYGRTVHIFNRKHGVGTEGGGCFASELTELPDGTPYETTVYAGVDVSAEVRAEAEAVLSKAA